MNNAHNVNQVRACHTEIGQMSSKRESENKVIFLSLCLFVFLGPRGPLVLPLVNPYARTPAMKIWTPIYRNGI